MIFVKVKKAKHEAAEGVNHSQHDRYHPNSLQFIAGRLEMSRVVQVSKHVAHTQSRHVVRDRSVVRAVGIAERVCHDDAHDHV